MKHGDQYAARTFAFQLADLIAANLEAKQLTLTSVPNSNPIPIQAVIDVVCVKLLMNGLSVERFDIDHTDASIPVQKNYGTMSAAERARSTTSKKLFLPPGKEPLLAGRTTILVDDLRATGNTEAYCAKYLQDCPVASFGFSYLIKFTDGLATAKPETEEELNRAYIREIGDLLPTVLSGWTINERVVRFILNLAPEPNINDLGEAEKTRNLQYFLQEIPAKELLELYKFSRAQAFQQPHYRKALALLETVTRERVQKLERLSV